MMIFVCVVLAVLSTVECEEVALNRQKRFAAAYAGFPWSFAGAGFPGAGFAGAGFPGFPFGGGIAAPSWDYPRAQYVPFPYIPFPVINIPKPWYEGENVCKETRYASNKQPAAEFGDWMNEDFSNMYSDYNAEHETCKGSNTKYVCVKRITDNTGEQKLEATKYSCCHGFVRDSNNGPGCVESGSQVAPIADDKIYYGLAPSGSGSSSSSSSVSSGKSIDKVPIQ